MSFNDCTIHNVDQNTPAWHELRRGVLTSSEIGDWLFQRKKFTLTVPQIKEELDRLDIEYKKSGQNKGYYEALLPNKDQYSEVSKGDYESFRKWIWKKVNSYAKGWEPEPPRENEWMQRGHELEPEARDAFIAETGKQVELVGFCKSVHGSFGASTDGLIYSENAVWENKSLSPENHNFWAQDMKQIPPDHIPQIHMEMAVTGATHCYFQLWNPGYPSYREMVKRSQYTEDLFTACVRFSEAMQKAFVQWSESD